MAASIISSSTEYSMNNTNLIQLTPTKYVSLFSQNAQIANIQSNGSVTYGTLSEYESQGTYHIVGGKLTDNKFVITYQYNTYDSGYAVIGEVDGSDNITFGSPVLFFNNRNDMREVLAIDDNRFFLSFKSGIATGYRGYNTVGTVTGISVSFGTNTQFGVNIQSPDISKIDNSNFLITYSRTISSQGNEAALIVGVDETNNITNGTELLLSTWNEAFPRSCMFGSNHAVIVYDIGSTTLGAKILTLDTAAKTITASSEFTSPGAYSDFAYYVSMVSMDDYSAVLGFKSYHNLSSWQISSMAISVDAAYSSVSFSAIHDIASVDRYPRTYKLSYDETMMIYDTGAFKFVQADGTISPTNSFVSEIYAMSSVKGNLRGKSLEGFIRPTIKQFFTSENFEEVASYVPAYFDTFPGMNGSIVITPDKLTFTNPLLDWHGPYIPMEKFSGKWYVEFLMPAAGQNWFIGVRESTEPLLNPNHYAPMTHVTYLNHSIYQGAGYSYPVTPIPPEGEIMAVGYDIENRIFTTYRNGVLTYTYDVDAVHPEHRMADGTGIYFCAGAYNASLTIKATPTYSISGYRYI